MSGVVRRLCLVAACVVVAGCDSASPPGTLTIAGVDVLGAGAAVAPAIPGREPILVTRLSDGASGTYRLVSDRAGVETWAAADGSAFAFRSGVLVSTNALGHDLYSADVSDVIDVLARGGRGAATRVHRYLDGEGELRTRAFECTLDVGPPTETPAVEGPVRVVRETCAGFGTGFTNQYLLSARDGGIVQSTQWVGEVVGSVRVTAPGRRPDPAARPILVPVAVIDRSREAP